MSNNIFEELPSRKGGEAKPGADAAAGIEKKARQLVYDSRYEVKKMLAGKRADPASQERMVLGRIAKSTAIPAVKARARQMVSKTRNIRSELQILRLETLMSDMELVKKSLNLDQKV